MERRMTSPEYRVVGTAKRGTVVAFGGELGDISELVAGLEKNWRVVTLESLGDLPEPKEWSFDSIPAVWLEPATHFVMREIRRAFDGGAVLVGRGSGAALASRISMRIPSVIKAVVADELPDSTGLKQFSPGVKSAISSERLDPAIVEPFLDDAYPEPSAPTPFVEEELLNIRAANPPLENPTLEEARERQEHIHEPAQVPPGFSRQIIQVEAETGPVEVRVLRSPSSVGNGDSQVATYRQNSHPNATIEQPGLGFVLVLVHGGGFQQGAAKFEDARAFDLLTDLPNYVWPQAPAQAVCVIPEYRLSPENPFPAGRDDVLATIRWVFEEFDAPVFLYGDSAGAGLIRQSLFELADAELTRLAGVIALEPDLEPAVDSRSFGAYQRGPGWTREQVIESWDNYLGNVPSYRVWRPLGATSENYPPMCIIVNFADGFRDEGQWWANELADAGVNTQLHAYPGTLHGFMSIPGTKTWNRIKRNICPFVADSIEDWTWRYA